MNEHYKLKIPQYRITFCNNKNFILDRVILEIIENVFVKYINDIFSGRSLSHLPYKYCK